MNNYKLDQKSEIRLLKKIINYKRLNINIRINT